MKLKVGKISLLFRLVAVSTVLLFGQQAMAVGTAAGTVIDNEATVGYTVGGNIQTDLTSSVSFVVDRRVDFRIDEVTTALVDVTPGETDAFFEFRLTNESNATLDFSLALSQIVGGPVRAATDDADMELVDVAVSASPASGTDDTPVRGVGTFVDELAADDSIRIRVYGDAFLAMLNGQVAGVLIDATPGESGTGGEGGALTVGAANGDLTIENVFANGGPVPGVESYTDGFIAIASGVFVTKSYAVIGGDLSSGLPIPGATVEYTILVDNTGGTADADAVVITDDMTNPVLPFVDLDRNVYGTTTTEDIRIVNGAAPAQFCDVDDVVDTDGCILVAPNLTVGVAGTLDITVAAGTTLTIQYQVTIPDP